MNEGYKNVPALLIGLGGIGSEIVDSVYGRLKETGMAENVEALVFDTDINSQRNLTNISGECKIQTSTDKTVKYALENDPTAKDWFPVHPLVEKMQMLNGAGQIRAVSRLALRSAMKAGKLNSVSAVKERLFKLGSGTSEKGLRVMIVSSMMGGTGSGMFLQIPLYIREIFESQFNTDKIEIQGTFILPDVLKGSITPEQTENVYANAYASMKELNAMIMSLGGDGSSINLEYKPNQLNSEGMRDIALKDWPYDYCYFYDKEDTKGRVLSGFKDYINMIENNLYLQVFGPISDRMYSNFINEMRGTIRKNGRNIYGGIGVGELSYPYDDIVDYCVYKVLASSLDNQLLKIDQIYRAEMDKYNRNIQNGIDDQMPDRENVYITNFESLATTDNFFSQIKRSLTEYDDNDNEVSDNIKKLQAAIDEEILSIYNNDEEFKAQVGACYIKPGSFSNLPAKKLRSVVSNCESRFRQFRITVEGKAQNKAESKANADWGVYSENDKSILNEFLRNKETYVNSVGIRYMLYKTHKNLKQAKIDLDNKLADTVNKLRRGEEKPFTSQSGAGVDAVKKAEEVVKSKGLFSKNLKNFKEDYARKAAGHFKLLEAYCKDSLKSAYYERSIKLLEVLISEYENMFSRLADQKYEVEKHIKSLLIKHDDTKGTTNLYVLANQKYKEQIWRTIPDDVKTSILSGTLSEEMHGALFSGFQKKVNNSIGQVVSYDKLFHDLIVKSCRERLLANSSVREELDINIMQALEREADFSGQSMSKQDYIKSRLNTLADSVCPWTPKSEDSSDFNLWGISSDCRTATESPDEKSSLEKLIDDASAGKLSANNVVSHNVLSKNSILFVTARYGLMVSDFVKFAAGKNSTPDGEYYVAYKNVVERIPKDGQTNTFADTSITPHIDKRWHLTLRDINDAVYLKNMNDVAKAFVIGIANKNFVVKQSDSSLNVTQFVSIFDGMPTAISYQGSPVDGKIKNLYKALSGNPDLVRNVMEEFEKYCENAQRNSNRDISVVETELIKKLNDVKVLGYDEGKNIVDVFINFERESTKAEKDDKNYEDKYRLFYNALYEVIEDAVKPYCFGQGDLDLKLNCNKVLNSLIQSSYWEEKLSKDDMVYARSLGQLKNKVENM
ncbi:MAG: hypothetical protein IKT42_00985 [Clostridia bacterium]|nr:hypothetical protein [Clostridia bacterium]